MLSMQCDTFRCYHNNIYRPGGKQKEINYREEEKKILDSVMRPENYDKRIRPSGINSTGE